MLMRTIREHGSMLMSGKTDATQLAAGSLGSEDVVVGKNEEKTWTPQQIPPNVPGAKPTQDKEPPAEPPKRPEKR
jgi:hypothetical protein